MARKPKQAHGTVITAHERAILSAVFARTNTGIDDPSMKEVRRLFTRHSYQNPEPHFADYVAAMVGGYCDDDAALEAYEGEAETWWKLLDPAKKEGTREYILETWPRIHFLMWSEPYYMSSTSRHQTEKQADAVQVRHPLSRRVKDGDEWVVYCLQKTPVQKGQAAFIGGYPNAGVPWHKAGAVL